MGSLAGIAPSSRRRSSGGGRCRLLAARPLPLAGALADAADEPRPAALVLVDTGQMQADPALGELTPGVELPRDLLRGGLKALLDLLSGSQQDLQGCGLSLDFVEPRANSL